MSQFRTALTVFVMISLVACTDNTSDQKSFSTYDPIEVLDSNIDLNSDDFDTLEYVAKSYINTHEKGNTLGEKFGLTYTSYGDKYPKSGFVGYEVVSGDQSLIKIQLAKDENGWAVANKLAANQIHQAHAVIADIEGNLRTVEGSKAAIVAAGKLENYLNDKSLIGETRSTSVNCYLTKTANKASCRTVYGLKGKNGVECHSMNYLLSNDGASWAYVSEILDTQSVDYKTGELVTKKPFSMTCQ